MKQTLSYRIPICKGHNIAEPMNEHKLSIIEQLEMLSSARHIDRFSLDLCGCLEDECTCYLLEEIERLVQKNQWWG